MSIRESYEDFVEKFKPKKTTDDCYTPAAVYDAITEHVECEYNIPRTRFVRPFWPGGDYENYDYPMDCVVVDNPPFSIVTKIAKFYSKNNIKFFIFAPMLTLFNVAHDCDLHYITTGVDIVYQNGARVNTSFVTNLEPGGFSTCPQLYDKIKLANKNQTSKRPKYIYPTSIALQSHLVKLCQCGINLKINSKHYKIIEQLDSQKKVHKTIYGSGLLLSNIAAEKIAAAQKIVAAENAAIQWQLSDREQAIIESMNINER